MATRAPRFRRDLRVSFVDEGEYRYAELTKADGESVRLYDFEYNLALELDGRPVDGVARSAHDKLGIEVDGKQVEEFARSLAELDLLEAGPEKATQPAAASGTRQPWNDASGEPTAMNQGVSELLAVATRRTEELSDDEMAAADADTDDGVVRGPADDATAPVEGPRAPEARAAVPEAARPTVPVAPSFPAPPTRGGLNMPAGRGDARSNPTLPGGPAIAEALDLSFDPSAPGGIQAPAAASGPGAPAGGGPETSVPPAAPSPASAKAGGRGWVIWAVLGLIAAIAAGIAAWKYLSQGKTPPVSVRTLVPSPVSVYRWFDAEAPVSAGQPVDLAFEAAGTVASIRPAGTRFEKGDVLALLDGGRRAADELVARRERLAAEEQIEAAKGAEGAAGNTDKLAEIRRLVVEAEGRLTPFAVLATQDGEIAETLVLVGAKVRAGTGALRLREWRHRAVFELGGEDAELTRRLAFCRVLVGGRPFACTFSPDSAPRQTSAGAGAGVDLVRIAVDVESDDDEAERALGDGATARLARARFDAVFTVPARALVAVGGRQRLFVASPGGHAEMRAVALADRTATLAVVAQGLDVGDAVIVDAPATLEPNAPIVVADRRFE